MPILDEPNSVTQPAKWLFEVSERGTSEDCEELINVCVLAGHPCRGR
jgi:hypothetical protein